MTDKAPLLDQLRAVAARTHDAERDEATWLARAREGLPADEERELEARAQVDETTATMREATAPRDATFDERLLRAAMAAHGAAKASGDEAPVAPERAAPPAVSGRVIPMRRWAVAVVPALAAAAALVLWLRTQPPTNAVDLPAYEVAVRGADAPDRGDPLPAGAARVALSAGARVHVVVRPATPVRSAVEASAFLVRGGDVRAVDAPVRMSPAGAAQIEGSFAELFRDARGDWDLVVFVAPRDSVPRTPADAARALEGGASARVARQALRLDGAGQ